MTTTEPAPTDTDEPVEAELVEVPPSVAIEKADAPVPMPAPALAPAIGLIPSSVELQTLAQMANTFAHSTLVPKPLQGKPEDCFLVLLTARDLGLAVTVAFRECHPIDGRVTVSPKLKLSMVRERALGRIWPAPDNDANAHTWFAARRDDPETVYSVRYTIDDATRAGMWMRGCTPDDHSEQCVRGRQYGATRDQRAKSCKTNWVTYPGQMCQWRSLGYLMDQAFGEVAVGLYCLPTRAEALTRSGWVTYEKLSVGDEILGFDDATGMCRWTPVQALNVYEAGQTYRIEHSRWASTATAEHRWVIQRKKWKGGNPGRVVRSTRDMRRGEGSLLIAAPAVDETSALDDREAAIIGWLLTDGSFRWGPDRGRGGMTSAEIQQSKHVETVRGLFRPGEAHEWLASPARTQTIKGTDYECRDGYSFKLSSAFARELLSKAGMRTKADAVLAVTRLSVTARRSMFDAMILANGSDAAKGPSGQKHVSFFTGHLSVMDAFLALCALLGQGTGRVTHTGGCWKVNLRRSKGVDVDRLSITEHTIEPVWCPTTCLGTWVTRLDGYTYITGNSADELGAVTDEEGRVIDIMESGPLDGMPDHTPVSKDPASGPNAVAPEDIRDQFKERIYRLPHPAVETLREQWARRQQDDQPLIFPLPVLPLRQVKSAGALIAGFESRAERGEWGPWEPAPLSWETVPEAPGSDPKGGTTAGEPGDAPSEPAAQDEPQGEPAVESVPDAPPYDPKNPPGDVLEAAIDRAKAIPDDELDAELEAQGQTVIAAHKPDTKRRRIVQGWFVTGWVPEGWEPASG